MPSTKGNFSVSEDQIMNWGPDDVMTWLRFQKLDFCIEDFKSLQIDGQRLLFITWDEFKTLPCLSDEKKKKLLKKSLGTLPGRGGAGKGKKFGGKKSKAPQPPPTNSISLRPPIATPSPANNFPPTHFDEGAPQLPPRPPKSTMPQSSFPNMRPPINSFNHQQQEQIEEETEDIYDAVPDQDTSNVDEDIYDIDEDEDSFDDEEVENETSNANRTIHQNTGNQKELFALKAKFFAHGIGTLTHMPSGAPMEDDDDDDCGEIYDLPPDMEEWMQEGGYPPHPPGGPPPQGGFPPPPGGPPPQGGFPPPPMSPPPDDDPVDDEIYDLPPEQAQGHTHIPVPPAAPPISDEFGYGSEELYDICDPEDIVSGDMPQIQPPRPPQIMPHPPINDLEEDIGGEEIYDIMDEPIETSQPPNIGRLQLKPVIPNGIGMRPPIMREPIPSQVRPNPAPPLINRPPMRAPPSSDVQQSKLDSSAGMPPPPLPNSSSKPSPAGYHEVQQKKLNNAIDQRPPPRPMSGTKPTATQAPPIPPPPPPALEQEEEEEADGGSLANQLALMKKRLRASSNASPSTTPPIERKNVNTSVTPNKSPTSNTSNTNDLASSIAEARKKLRERDSSPAGPPVMELPKKETVKPSPVVKQVNKETNKIPTPSIITTKTSDNNNKPLLGNKPVAPNNKPLLKEKPAIGKKPTVAPKSNKIASLMNNFQKSEETTSSITSSPQKKIELDRSPMTGRKIERKESVKELTQRYSSDEDGVHSPTHNNERPPPNMPRPPSKELSPPPAVNNPAMNAFRRKQVEAEDEIGPPPLPSLTSKKNLPPPIDNRKQPNVAPPTNSTTPPPELPKRSVPAPVEAPPPIKDIPRPLPNRGKPAPPPLKNIPRPSLPPPTGSISPLKITPPTEDVPPPLPSRPGVPQETRSSPRPQISGEPPLPPRNMDRNSLREPLQETSRETSPQEVPREPPRPSRSLPATSLSAQSWYHAKLDRKNSEAKIKRYSKDGTFIVRDNTRTLGEYSLSLWHDGAVRHLRIRKRNDDKFVLGEEKADEVAFVNVVDLINYYKSEPVVLKSGGSTPLKYECPH